MNCKGNSIGSLIKAFSFQSTHTFLAFHYYLGPIFFFWLYKTGFFLLFLFFNHYLSEVNSAQPLIGQKSQQCSSWTVDGSRLENPGGKYSHQIYLDWFDSWLTGPDGYMVNDYRSFLLSYPAKHAVCWGGASGPRFWRDVCVPVQISLELISFCNFQHCRCVAEKQIHFHLGVFPWHISTRHPSFSGGRGSPWFIARRLKTPCQLCFDETSG